MKHQIRTFDYLIDPKYFPGYKIVKPFYVRVAYEFIPVINKVTIQTLSFSFNAFPSINVNSNLLAEIEQAAKHHSEYEPIGVVELAEEVLLP